MKMAQSVMLGFVSCGVVLGGGAPAHLLARVKTPLTPRFSAVGPDGIDHHRRLLMIRKLRTFVACSALAVASLVVVAVIVGALVTPAIVIVTSTR
jgi:hypothetical protein